MDRAEAIELIRNIHFSTMNVGYKLSLIRAYLEERGFERKKVIDAINFLYLSPLINRAADVASEYFERKFTIYKLFKVIPLNLGAEEKRLLMVF